jgi:hypothetical protein
MNERRIRQIISEELVAAGLKCGPSVMGRIQALNAHPLFSEAAIQKLAEDLLNFQREGRVSDLT